MQKARERGKPLKKFFLEALPLLQQYPRYADAVVELAYAEEDLESHVALAEAMELLSERLQTPSFREATAHAMAIKAVELFNSNLNPVAAEKLLKKALAIYPDSRLAQTTLADVRHSMALDELGKAFKRQNVWKAAKLVNRDRDPRHIDFFFETMERWFQSVSTWQPRNQLPALRDFYGSCRLVDSEHPLTVEIGAEIRRLEEK
jgi:hypothetical protein